jgi:steroid delta-isomerase-like uncharacterized protein
MRWCKESEPWVGPSTPALRTSWRSYTLLLNRPDHDRLSVKRSVLERKGQLIDKVEFFEAVRRRSTIGSSEEAERSIREALEVQAEHLGGDRA